MEQTGVRRRTVGQLQWEGTPEELELDTHVPFPPRVSPNSLIDQEERLDR